MGKKHRYRHRTGRGGLSPELWDERYEEKKKIATNVHHILNKCRRADFNVEDVRNKVRLLVCEHNELHHSFKNMTPQEIILYMLNLARDIIRPDVLKKVEDCVRINPKEFYDDGLVR